MSCPVNNGSSLNPPLKFDMESAVLSKGLEESSCTSEDPNSIKVEMKVEMTEEMIKIKEETKEIKEETKEIKEETKEIKEETKEIKEETKEIKEEMKEITEEIGEKTEGVSLFDSIRLGLVKSEELQSRSSSSAESVPTDSVEKPIEDSSVPVPSLQNEEAPHTEMDAVLEEESKRLDIVMSPSKKDVAVDDNLQPMDKNIQYKRLIELLTKSQFYTEFLVKKLETDSLKEGSQRRGRRKAQGDDSKTDAPCGSSLKSRQTDSKRVMEIAADVISNKKPDAETVNDEIGADDVGQTKTLAVDVDQTKTLANGLVVPANQPKLLTGASLRDYQMEGLNWLKLLFENGVNGILADEMGLGKTIQVISLICHLIEKNVRGPFLVIGPLSTLPNWAIEFEKFAPKVPFIVYHGSEDKRIDTRKKMGQKKVIEGHKVYPVILTSYDYPLRDLKYLKKMHWRYIIIDEGHRLKNHNSQLSRALRQYTSANRLLLTGTPLHNSLSELWSLLNFLVPEIFDDLEIFESWFRLEDLSSEGASEKVLEDEKKNQVLSTMHKILSPFMLRRVKSQVQLNLPPKKELIVYAPMTPIQLDLYRAVLDFNYSKLRKVKEEEETIIETEDGKRAKRTCTLAKKFYCLNEIFQLEDALLENPESAPCIDNKTLIVRDKENVDYAIRVKMQNAAMMLRKIVNHPYLVQYPLEPGTEYARIDEDIVKVSGKLLVLDAMLTKLKERGHKVLLFSTFTSAIDILEDYLSLRSFTHVRLDGNTSLDDRQTFIKQYNSDPNLFLFLISTRAGGLGINLASADTVIIFDSDWNPQVDLQAQDRCHRIGQTRPVVVYRFVTAGTIDERIVVRAAAKRRLEKIIIQKGNYSAIQKSDEHSIDLDELQKLLTSRDHQRVIHPNGYVFSDQELDGLLDRSDLIEGRSCDLTSDGEGVEERSFKEYYGYTGMKKESQKEETSNSVEIVDQDSNDAPCEILPVRRNHLEKNCSFGTTLAHEQVSAENGQCEELKPDGASVINDLSKKRRNVTTDSNPAKKYKPTKENSDVFFSSKNSNDSSDSTTTRSTRATRRK